MAQAGKSGRTGSGSNGTAASERRAYDNEMQGRGVYDTSRKGAGKRKGATHKPEPERAGKGQPERGHPSILLRGIASSQPIGTLKTTRVRGFTDIPKLATAARGESCPADEVAQEQRLKEDTPVSYTHLTLPTKRIV